MSAETTQIAVALARFDGPFDLLLALVRRNQYPLDELPLVAITAQFLAYVKEARDLDADLGGEFVEVASWLVLLKSRSLLPAEAGDGPTPREELRRTMLDPATLTATTDFLRGRSGETRPGGAGALAGQSEAWVASEAAPCVQDLLEAARRALHTARLAESFENRNVEGVTVEDQIRWIGGKLAALPAHTAVSTADWFETQAEDESRASLLLALLEMARRGAILLHQSTNCESIVLKINVPVHC